MFVGVLGGLVVRDATGAELTIGRGLPRRAVAALAVAEGRPVAAEALVAAMWDDPDIDSAKGSLHSTISRLRRVLDAGRAQTALRLDAAGYRLDLEPDQIDASLFARLAREGRGLLSTDPHAALARLEEADALWRGPALAEFADLDFARAPAARLDSLRVDALEDALEARLALGAGVELLDQLAELSQAHPLRERLRGQRAIALYRAGRQSEALAEIAATRELLREELGIDPSPALRDIETRVLRQDDSLSPSADVAAQASMPAALRAPATAKAAPAAAFAIAPAVAGAQATPASPATERAAGPDERQRLVAPAGTTSPSPVGRLAGRDGELALLQALLAETSTGATRFALVEGEPGIGKTRLLEEVAAVAVDQGMRVVWGRCADSEVAPAYWPWLEALRTLRAEGALPDASPELTALLDPSAAAEQAPADALRFRLFEVVASALVAAAGATPLVVVVEDLHWADPASAGLLNHLAVRLHGVPVAVIGSLRQLDIGREDAVTEMVAAVVRREGTRRLSLHPVPASATSVLIRAAVGEDVEVPVASAIHRRAQGNPFFIGELSRLLRDAGRLGDPTAAEGLRVPVAVRDVVRRRLAGLPTATRAVLETAAVLGGEADLPVIARAGGRSLEETIDAIEPALASHVLTPLEDNPGRFRFTHALVRDATMTEVAPLRSAQLHARAADALSELYSGDDDAAEAIASHLWHAVGVVGQERAARALEQAADVAMRRTAYETADDLLSRALTLWRAAGGATAQESEIVTTVRLVSLRRWLHGYQHSYESMSMDRAEELALKAGRSDLYLGLLFAEWASVATGGDVAGALRLAERIRRLAAEADDPVTRFSGGLVWAITCWHRGLMEEAAATVAAVEADLAQLSDDDMRRLADIESAGLSMAFMTHIRIVSGVWEPGGQFDDFADSFDNPYDRVVLGNFAGLTAMMRADHEEAWRWSQYGAEHNESVQSPLFGGSCQMYGGWALGRRGRTDEGMETFERGLRSFRQSGARTGLGLFASARVDLMLRAGVSPDDAAAYLSETEPEVEAMGERWPVPYLIVARARIARARGDEASARALVGEALALADEMSMPLVRRFVDVVLAED